MTRYLFILSGKNNYKINFDPDEVLLEWYGEDDQASFCIENSQRRTFIYFLFHKQMAKQTNDMGKAY